MKAVLMFPAVIKSLPPYSGRFDATKLVADGCEVLFASYPAGTHIEPHTHTSHNHGVITQGEMFLTIEGVETRYGVGDWYEVPAGTVHSARCHVDTTEIEFWFETTSV